MCIHVVFIASFSLALFYSLTNRFFDLECQNAKYNKYVKKK